MNDWKNNAQSTSQTIMLWTVWSMKQHSSGIPELVSEDKSLHKIQNFLQMRI